MSDGSREQRFLSSNGIPLYMVSQEILDEQEAIEQMRKEIRKQEAKEELEKERKQERKYIVIKLNYLSKKGRDIKIYYKINGNHKHICDIINKAQSKYLAYYFVNRDATITKIIIREGKQPKIITHDVEKYKATEEEIKLLKLTGFYYVS